MRKGEDKSAERICVERTMSKKEKLKREAKRRNENGDKEENLRGGERRGGVEERNIKEWVKMGEERWRVIEVYINEDIWKRK